MATLKKVNHTRVLWIFLLVFPHLKPRSIAIMWPQLEVLFNAGRMFSILASFAIFICGKKKKNGFVVALIALMEIWITLMTYIHRSQPLFSNIVFFGSALSVPLIMYCYSDSLDELLAALYMNYEWLIYANLITVVLFYPRGLYVNSVTGLGMYFLGNENALTFYAIPAIFLALLNIRRNIKKLRSIMLIVACLVDLLWVWCVTGILGMVISTVIMLYVRKKKRQPRYYVLLAVLLTVDILIAVVRILDRYWLTVYIIKNVFGKTLTLSGRVRIWNIATPLISNNLWTGLGRGDHVVRRNLVQNAHNEYFELLLEGGLPLLLLFMIILLYYGVLFKKGNSVSFVKTITLSMLVYLLVEFIAGAKVGQELYVPLILASYMKEIEDIVENRLFLRDLRSFRITVSLPSADKSG